MGHHTTSDDASRYRTKDEVAEWSKERPDRDGFRAYLKGKGLWDEDFEKRVNREAEPLIRQGRRGSRERRPRPRPEDYFAPYL